MADKQKSKGKQILDGLNKALVDNTLGGAVDLAAMAINGPIHAMNYAGQKFGLLDTPIRTIDKPFLGSEHLIGLMGQAGMVDPAEGGLLEDAVRLGAGIFGPAAVAKAPQVAEKAGKVAKKAVENAMAPSRLNKQAGVFLPPDIVPGGLDKVREARALEGSRHPKDIYKATGVWRGPEGKWRIEVPDNKMMTRAYAQDQARVSGKAKTEWADTMAQEMPAWQEAVARGEKTPQEMAEYFKDYEDAYKLSAKMQAQHNAEAAALKRADIGPTYPKLAETVKHDALFDVLPEARQITGHFGEVLSPGMTGGYMDTGRGYTEMLQLDPGSTRKGLVHELQHFVQDTHGLPRGGTPTMFDPGDFGFREYSKNVLGYDLDKDPGLLGTARHETYMRLAGEAEARAAAERIHMSPFLRQANYPLDSYDRYLDQLIIDPYQPQRGSGGLQLLPGAQSWPKPPFPMKPYTPNSLLD